MAWLRCLTAGVIHDGEGGTYPVGHVFEASEETAASLVAAGAAEGADPPAAPAAPINPNPSPKRKANGPTPDQRPS